MIKGLTKEKNKNVNVKIPMSDYLKLAKLAKKYARGNVSAWIRWASTQTLAVPLEDGKQE